MGDNSFVKYADLLNVKGADPETNKEKFVFLPAEGEYVFGRYGEPMMDMAGKTLRQGVYGGDQGANRINFGLADVAKGIYLLEISNPAGKSVRKVTVQ